MRKKQEAKLFSLSEEQRKQIEHWLNVERLTYDEAVARIKTEFALEVSRSALGEYWQTYCAPQEEKPGEVLCEILISIESPRDIRVKVIQGTRSK